MKSNNPIQSASGGDIKGSQSQIKLKPPLSMANLKETDSKNRSNTPIGGAASLQQKFSGTMSHNNFRLQTAKGIRSSAFINFSQQSTSAAQITVLSNAGLNYKIPHAYKVK